MTRKCYVAFKIGDWKPSSALINKLSVPLPESERQRIQRFHFKADQIRALAGQILIRHVIRQVFLPDAPPPAPGDIVLDRSEAGKPLLVGPIPDDPDDLPNFNLSHHGDWVIASSITGYTRRVGCDVTKVDAGREKDAPSFMSVFKSHFSPREWEEVYAYENNAEGRGDPSKDPRLHAFFRLWCLKESYIKGIGLGLQMDLVRLEFRVGRLFWNNKMGRTDIMEDGIEVCVDGVVQPWIFRLGYIDSNHPYAVAIEMTTPLSEGEAAFAPFDFLDNGYIESFFESEAA